MGLRLVVAAHKRQTGEHAGERLRTPRQSINVAVRSALRALFGTLNINCETRPFAGEQFAVNALPHRCGKSFGALRWLAASTVSQYAPAGCDVSRRNGMQKSE